MRPMTDGEKRPGRMYVGHICPTYRRTSLHTSGYDQEYVIPTCAGITGECPYTLQAVGVDQHLLARTTPRRGGQGQPPAKEPETIEIEPQFEDRRDRSRP